MSVWSSGGGDGGDVGGGVRGKSKDEQCAAFRSRYCSLPLRKKFFLKE